MTWIRELRADPTAWLLAAEGHLWR